MVNMTPTVILEEHVTLTPAQIRGARAMLRMLQGDLAKAAGLTPKAMNSIETGASRGRASTLIRLRSVLEERGIVFFESREGKGVMLRDEVEVVPTSKPTGDEYRGT